MPSGTRRSSPAGRLRPIRTSCQAPTRWSRSGCTPRVSRRGSWPACGPARTQPNTGKEPAPVSFVPAPRAMVVINGEDTHHDLITAALVFQQIGIEAGFATRRAAGTCRYLDPRPETAQCDVYLH